MPAPAYNSYKWIQEDWRYIKLVKGDLFSDVQRISFDKRCGERAKGDKKPRLCLPKIVIQRLIKTENGKKALLDQMEKKEKSKLKKVSWNKKVSSEMAKFYDEQKKKGLRDDPTKRKREISRNLNKPNAWHVEYVQKSTPRIIQNKWYKLQKFATAGDVKKAFLTDKKRTMPIIARDIQIKKITKTYKTYYK